jgi:hypothetical protein
MNGVSIGKVFFSKDSQHCQNKAIYASMVRDSIILHLVMKGDRNGDKRKLVQFAIDLHLLMEGMPITNFESLKFSFK